jgi:16S rRNA processing protein RimM
VVGLIRRPHGLRGEILLELVTDFPERIHSDIAVFLGHGRKREVVESTRSHHRGLLIKFRGIDSLETAHALRGQTVYVPSIDRPALEPGRYYHHQILGADVINERDESIGSLSEILQTGANDVFVVKPSVGREILLPVIASVVLLVDPERRIIRVRVPDGLGGDGRA